MSKHEETRYGDETMADCWKRKYQRTTDREWLNIDVSKVDEITNRKQTWQKLIKI